MFRSFFLNRRWWPWSILGSMLILASTWYQVELNVQINEWFGSFYDMVQKALGTPNAVSSGEYYGLIATFLKIAMIYVIVGALTRFFISHYIFRWRTAMNDFYMANWERLRHVEGASQRVQDDTMRFASTMEGLGVAFLDAILTLIAFLPILWALSEKLTDVPILGAVPHALVWIAIIWSLFGTMLLALVGIKLPGLQFNNQKVEAAYRKELVYGEDDAGRAQPPTVASLFSDVRHNYFRLYFNYMYFNVVRISYLQLSVIVSYVAMGPSIVAGAITLGVMQQIGRAFDQVQSSFQYLVNSWTVIVELMSIYKRLKAFEEIIRDEGGPKGGLLKEVPASATVGAE